MASIKFKTVEEYIKSFSPDVQKILREIQSAIKSEIPDGEEVISYNIPCVKLNGKYVIYYSAWKHHTSLYPFSAGMEKEFPGTKDYNTSGKGTIQFPLDKPVPADLIRKITRARLNLVK